MKFQVKRIIRKCDKTGCENEIENFEEYKNVCFICHKDFCDKHITLYKNDDTAEEFAICSNCFNKLSDDFEKVISEDDEDE